MGCDIHCYAERKGKSGKFEVVNLPEAPFSFYWRSYSLFGFLAGVRNYSNVHPIAEPRGFPEDASNAVKADYDDDGSDAHTPSWLSVEELEKFDYNQQMEDRRVGRQLTPNLYSGGETCDPGEGTLMTYRQFLGRTFFSEIQKLKEAGADRIVFWFDN